MPVCFGKEFRSSILLTLLIAVISLFSPLSWAHDENSGEGLLPSHRIVAYYGNFYSQRMGVLGQYPEKKMLKMLQREVDKWNRADPDAPVIPAIEYIAIVAQADAGRDGKFRTRMPDSEIQKAIDIANKIDGIVILDVQVGQSNVQTEVPRLEEFLILPNVMLALDPEFSMHNGQEPGDVIGTMDARDINWTSKYLAKLARKHDLPPKILVVHRFTQRMVTNAKKIKLRPEVQIVMDMDGWGSQHLKRSSYRHFIAPEPVEYTGFKMFYDHDTRNGGELYTPEQILKFDPVPMFIMYQ